STRDWSSDVCSSDLISSAILASLKVLGGRSFALESAVCARLKTRSRCASPRRTHSEAVVVNSASLFCNSFARFFTDEITLHFPQIGRASCRERVYIM